MKLKTIGTSLAAGALVLAGLLGIAGHAGAQDPGSDEQSKIKKGFEIAPVTLKTKGKNLALVGLGSYLVNAVGGCNDCHTFPSYAADHNPYAGQTKQVNAAAYLGGGVTFGPFTSRNLTPGKSGLVAGDMTYEEFAHVMRTGKDPDGWHPVLPIPGLDGSYLQVMPWPVYQSMTDHDLRAVYEYLSSIPCVEGDPGNPGGADTHGQRCPVN